MDSKIQIFTSVNGKKIKCMVRADSEQGAEKNKEVIGKKGSNMALLQFITKSKK